MDRTGYIGGSDAAPIIGISPFKSRLDVWAEKRGTAEPEVETPSMMLGLYMEPFIRAIHELASGEKIVSVPQRTHHEIPWMRARLDGKVKGQPIVYEAKTAALPFDWGETIPKYYLPQVQHYLAVTGWDEARVVAMIGGRLPLKVYTIYRDDDYIRDLIEVESEFWYKNVIEGVEPEPDGNPAAEEWLRRRHPVEVEPLRVATPEETFLVERLTRTKMALVEATLDHEAARQALMAHIGDSTGIEGPGFKITWKKSKDSVRVGWEQVATALENMVTNALIEGRFQYRETDPTVPMLVDLYSTTQPGSRRFLANIEGTEA